MPSPGEQESEDDFIDRCMSDSEAVADFPGRGQRFAFCTGQFEKRKSMTKQFSMQTTFCKVDEDLGLIMGFAIISKIKGVDYFDSQGDHIPEDAMPAAATDFMLNSRVAKEMHEGEQIGDIVFMWPMTTDIAKAFGIETDKTGLMVAMKPDDEEILQKARDGEFTGFSIGGERVEDEIVEE